MAKMVGFSPVSYKSFFSKTQESYTHLVIIDSIIEFSMLGCLFNISWPKDKVYSFFNLTPSYLALLTRSTLILMYIIFMQSQLLDLINNDKSSKSPTTRLLHVYNVVSIIIPK